MPIDSIRLTTAVLTAVLLSGCMADGTMSHLGEPSNFGEASRQTFAAQVIDPAPVYDTLVPETSAEHAGQAAERYRTDKVKLPDKTATTDAGAGGSGGGQ